MFIYVAGPLTAPTEEEHLVNVNNAIAMGIALMKKGHHAIVPHLTHYMDAHPDCDFPNTSAFWVEWYDFPFLDKCEAIYMMEGWRDSKGATKEWIYATQNHKLRFYDLDEVPNISLKPEFRKAMGMDETE